MHTSDQVKLKNSLEYFSFIQSHQSGGAGYVLSKEALRRYGTRRRTPPECIAKSTNEDVEMSRCLQQLGVTLLSSFDDKRRTHFHPYQPVFHVVSLSVVYSHVMLFGTHSLACVRETLTCLWRVQLSVACRPNCQMCSREGNVHSACHPHLQVFYYAVITPSRHNGRPSQITKSDEGFGDRGQLNERAVYETQ